LRLGWESGQALCLGTSIEDIAMNIVKRDFAKPDDKFVHGRSLVVRVGEDEEVWRSELRECELHEKQLQIGQRQSLELAEEPRWPARS
jgi:hypothetical protein